MCLLGLYCALKIDATENNSNLIKLKNLDVKSSWDPQISHRRHHSILRCHLTVHLHPNVSCSYQSRRRLVQDNTLTDRTQLSPKHICTTYYWHPGIMGWMDLTDVHLILVLKECEVPLRGLHGVILALHEGWTPPGLAFVNGPCNFFGQNFL